jgi:hypothetical protein
MSGLERTNEADRSPAKWHTVRNCMAAKDRGADIQELKGE